MAEKQQNNEVNLEKMDQVSGGYVGKDKYTAEQYNLAGVSWQHNIWSKDKYYFNGKQITQKEAEAIVDLYLAGKLGNNNTKTISISY